MKDLQPYANDFDKWVFSLLELLRTKYFDVSVNRHRDTYIFYYKQREDIEYTILDIPIWELKGYYMSGETPKQIKDLL